MAERVSRTVLLCTEGSGRGKGVYLRALGAAITRLGHRRIYAVPAGSPCAAVLADEAQVLDARRIRPPLEQRVGNVATCGDLLANHGFASADILEEKILNWRRILEESAPDLVVSDWAPAASLAARGRMPVLVSGNGFYAPPPELDRFPALHDLSSNRADEERMLELVNRAAGRSGAAPLEALPALFGGDGQAVRTFSLLDPYRDWRHRNALCAPVADLKRADGSGEEIFVYLWIWTRPQLVDVFVEALCRVRRPMRIHSVSLNAAQAEKLQAAGVAVEPRPIAESAILSRSRLVVHSGGLMLTSLLLAAGVPQFIAIRGVEDYLNAKALEKRKCCRSARLDSISPDRLAAMISEAYEDEELSAAAIGLRGALFPEPANDWADRIAQRAVALL